VNSPVIEPKAKLALVANLANEPRVHHLKAPGEQRLKAQDFIKGIFKEHHQAKVSSFLPSLFAIFNPQGQTQSALGVRNAAQDKLYLEQYLDSSIDQLLESLLGEAVKRREVVEIGNLASQNSASCKALFAHITQYLQDQNVKWITCTGTATLRVVFKRLGIKAIPIHKADQDRLGEEQYAWGDYYQNDPQVMLINVRETNQHFINQKKAAQKLSATH
jgi:hypothetical protein